MVHDRFLGGKNIDLHFNSNIVKVVLKFNVGGEKTCFHGIIPLLNNGGESDETSSIFAVMSIFLK